MVALLLIILLQKLLTILAVVFILVVHLRIRYLLESSEPHLFSSPIRSEYELNYPIAHK